ncbi:SusC/RagA family TonB-linked outer membrane protein [Paraflavitalea devenefica]|uniref:SusC/RagA family TonB-linked outer membrane protein n=1 Tax=Paraflavitalea devenefica TaxID=2716334 RepID=UPI001ABAC2E3|nr:SusC/RagA family TonB-linked outer membrane protein [Paraflavitalea devenefica]
MKKFRLRIQDPSFVMKVALVQCFITLALSASLFATDATGQGVLDKKISVSVKNEDIKSALRKLSLEAGIKFSYARNTLPEKEKVTVTASNEALSAILRTLLQPYNISFEAVGSQVILKRNKLYSYLTQDVANNSAAAPFLKPIKGSIKDAAGNPVPGVSVVVKGSQRGTSTAASGNFEIEANEGDVLVISAVGFQTLEVTVGAKDEYAIQLVNAANAMNEVVVTALGIKRESKAIGYSAQKVVANDITKAAAPDLATGLMGKSAGLNITASNGIQGGSSKIVIRGNNSILGNNQPLLVIDGIQVQNEPIGGMASTAAGADVVSPKDWGSVMNFINSDEVEDVTVLKGAAAAALYGARGSNGVILITTKKGSKRPGLGIDYNVSTFYTNAYRYQDVQNEYGYGGANALWTAEPGFPTTASGELRYPGNYPWDAQPAGDKYQVGGAIPGGYSSWDKFSWYGPAASWGRKLDGTEIIWWDGVKRTWSPQPDNRKAFFRTGNTTTHNLSFSGGGDFGTVRVGLSRLTNTAIVPNSNYDQNNINLGSSLIISKKLKAEVSASYTNYNRLNTPDPANDNGWAQFMIYGMPRDYRPIELSSYRLADGSKNFFAQTSPLGYYPYNNNAFSDMFWELYMNNQELKRNQLLGSIKLTADLTPWLSVAGRASLSYAMNTIETKNYPTNVLGTLGAYGVEQVENKDVNFEAFTTLHKDNLFGKKINGSLMIGNAALKSRMHDVNSYNKGPFSVPFQYYLANNTTNSIASPTEARRDYNINSLFGILDLSYDNYLFLQVAGRNDWSSTLPIQTSSYFFPSASASFIFTEAFRETFSDMRWLSYGKLKVSAAESANGTNPYQTQYTYNQYVISNFLNTEIGPGSFGGYPVRSLQASLPPANLLKPQRNNSYEAGFELGFFNNRLNVDFTYYSSKATSQILSATLATSSGASAITFNTGELSNKGFEFIIKGTPVQTRDLRWDVTFNGAHNQNKVVSLAEGVDKYQLASLWGSNGVMMYAKVGENYGTIYGYDYTYLNGKKVVKRVMSDGGSGTQVVGTQYVTTTDVVPIGNATPKLTGGLSNNVRYKNFSLYVLTDFKLGGDLFSADYSAAIGEGLSPKTLKERNGGGLAYTYPDGTKANHGVILDGVFADGTPNTDVVHYMWKYAGTSQAWSNVNAMPRSEGVFENTWVKLREVTLTYSIPAKFLKGTKVLQGLDISFIGRNLFYLYSSLPDNLNPEAVNGVGNGQGIQWAQFPGTRDLGFSVKARF